MFWFQEAAEHTAEHAEHPSPIIVQLVNHYFGEWAYNFEMKYTYPLWKSFFAKFGTTPAALFGHLSHLAGPIWWIAPLIFPIELISNFIRPFSLGIRLFGNLFADEKVAATMAGVFPPYTYWLIPVNLMLMVLSVFVSLIQTF